MRGPVYSQRSDEIFSPETLASPHALFSRLRRERPLSRVGETGVHLVASWDLIQQVLARPSDFSANLSGVLIRGEDGTPARFEFPDLGGSNVIATADDPEHAVHRALTQPRLASKRIASLEEALHAWSAEALIPWLEAGGGDFVPIAERVPARAIALLLGLPDGDVSRHRRWAMMGGDMLAGAVSRGAMASLAHETGAMSRYLGEALAAAKSAPDPGPNAPLLHALARGVLHGQISDAEAVGIAVVMFGAGGESTAALLASCVHRLASDTKLADTLRSEPALIPRFVEEIVRLEPPFKFHYRRVRRPCRLAGFDLAADDRLMLLWASANRDATVFDEPDALRLDRRYPNHHMGFGRGTHFCIGAPVARLEARVVVGELLRRTREICLDPDCPPRWAPSIFVRRLEALEILAGTELGNQETK